MLILLLFLSFFVIINNNSITTVQSFGFDVHHRYSDTVNSFLNLDGLPEKGTLDYFTAMAHRDHYFKARRLSDSSSLLTFFGGNETVRIPTLGFLHYSVVSVGTPPVEFIVALDTGSDLFWLPCDCVDCQRSLNSTAGTIELNMYSSTASSTSSLIPCNSTMCGRRRGCSLRRNACAYQEVYLSSNTSSTGILVDDVIHLGTDTTPQTSVNASITLGCGIIQTGDFLDGAAINGLFGLGMDNVSVPSTLASRGLAANSFSMCFSPEGLGRIEFGDKGSPDQQVTPFNLETLHPTYNITVTQIAVARNVTNVEFTAIFDSGTSFTYLNDPAYSVIVNSFDSQITEPRYQPPTRIIFDYCYSLGTNQDSYTVPDMNLTMGGGSQYYVTVPTVVIPRRGGLAYCLAIVKSEDINIIGQNFMTGYRIVFDREEMVLGWKESTCNDLVSSNTLPVNRNNSRGAPPPSSLNPEATPSNRTRIPVQIPQPPRSNTGSNAARRSSASNTFVMVMFSFFFHKLIIQYL